MRQEPRHRVSDVRVRSFKIFCRKFRPNLARPRKTRVCSENIKRQDIPQPPSSPLYGVVALYLATRRRPPRIFTVGRIASANAPFYLVTPGRSKAVSRRYRFRHIGDIAWNVRTRTMSNKNAERQEKHVERESAKRVKRFQPV